MIKNNKNLITVAFNPTCSVGQDGDWAEGNSKLAAIEQAYENISGTHDSTESLTTLGYEIVNLWELPDLSYNAFSRLHAQWRLARHNGWTSDEADKIMMEELVRREEEG
jgi:hypothetical protein